MGLGEKLTQARGAGIPWAQKTGVQKFFTVGGPIIYIAWGIFLLFVTLVAAIFGVAVDQNRRR